MIGNLSAAFLGVVGKGILLVEAVTQQGADSYSGNYERVEIVVPGATPGDTTVDSNGNSATADGAGGVSGYSPGSGWSYVSTGGNAVTFQCDTVGAKNTTYVSGLGAVNVLIAGYDDYAGQTETHTITPARTPTGGTAVIGGSSTAYNATPSVAGWTFDQALSAGVVTATADAVGVRSDTALAPDGSGLTG